MGDIGDYTIEQNWSEYSEEEHAIWRLLFERQQRLLVGRACREYLDGLQGLGVAAGGIPDFRRLSDILDRATGWRIVAVPGLVPGRHLLRLSGAPAVSVDLLHPPPRPARLSAGAGRLSRHLRPRADADEPGLRRLHAGLWRGRAEGAAARPSGAAGAALLVHRRVRADRDGRRAADLRLGHPLLGRQIGLLPGRSAPQSRCASICGASCGRGTTSTAIRRPTSSSTISTSCSPRRGPISRRSIARSRCCREIAPDEVLPGRRGPSRRARAGKKKGPHLSTARV